MAEEISYTDSETKITTHTPGLDSDDNNVQS